MWHEVQGGALAAAQGSAAEHVCTKSTFLHSVKLNITNEQTTVFYNDDTSSQKNEPFTLSVIKKDAVSIPSLLYSMSIMQ